MGTIIVCDVNLGEPCVVSALVYDNVADTFDKLLTSCDYTSNESTY
jgi:hypothetical protein